MGVSEKLELLGTYEEIPSGVITIKSIPTASELDYVGAEDFERVMLDKVFPQVIEEKFDYSKLLEIDFQWVCRGLRILSYGPYYTTNAIYCSSCGETSRGEYQVNLMTIDCIPLPKDFINSITISKSEFIDFKEDIVLHLPTIQETLNARADKLFKDSTGRSNRDFARMCYMISSIGNRNLPVVEIANILKNTLSSADYILLKDKVNELTNYGLRAGGRTVCPKCRNNDAAYIALVDDRFFRPTVGDIRSWGNDRSKRADKDVPANKTGTV